MSLVQKLRAWAHELTGYFIFLLLTATLGPFLFGYHLAELNAPQDVITCLKRSIRSTDTKLPQCMHMNATQIGMVASAFTVGGLVGALAAGPGAARYGRLRPLRFTTLFATIGPITEALAPNIVILIVGRFLSGLGAGAALVVVPLYISEIAPPSEKGFFGAFTQIMTNAGIFSAQLVGYFLSYDQMWRIILAIGGIVAILQFAGLLFAVESPKWQANNGQPRAARSNLQRIRGHDVDLNEETKGWSTESTEQSDGEQQALLGSEGQRFESSLRSKDKNRSLGTFEVFRDPNSRYGTLAGMMVLSAQQFCGINAIIMYGVTLLSSLLQSNSALLNIFVSILNIVATTSFAPLIDVLGRKTCLLTSLATMGLASILLGIGIRGAFPALSIISVLLFVGGFSFGLGPVPFLLSSELVGPEAGGAAQSWGLAANWIATFIIAQFFPIVNELLGKGVTFFIFAGLDALFFALVFFIIPETMGKKDADEVWGREPRRDD